MANRETRELTIEYLSTLGVVVPSQLPLIDEFRFVRGAQEILDRMMAMHAVAASAYGFPTQKAAAWLAKTRSGEWLTRSEREFMATGSGNCPTFKLQIEGVFALAWTIQLVESLDPAVPCPSNFVTLMPNIRLSEGVDRLASIAKLRPTSELESALDIYYCLSWLGRESTLQRRAMPAGISQWLIAERRRALEWVTTDIEWSDLTLDT